MHQTVLHEMAPSVVPRLLDAVRTGDRWAADRG
jgi:hypothetical protein